MQNNYKIINARIVNEGSAFKGEVWIRDEKIFRIIDYSNDQKHEEDESFYTLIDAEGKLLIPGVIDDQVHFRDPGLTHKADIYTESKAAVAGGTTSFMEMPNTKPQTLTIELLEKKYKRAAEVSLANFSFYLGASNDNIDEVVKLDPLKNCGVKVFMGASTGNMLVDNPVALRQIFSKANTLVAVHSEDEESIRKNEAYYRGKYGEDVPVKFHPMIRSREACYKSSALAVELATKYNTRLHILHLSTKEEMDLFDNVNALKHKRITSEVCVHHLWFDENDYEKLGTRIKWNPAIKSSADREALWKALLDNHLDVVATDHAPHTLDEKNNAYFRAPSGGPLVQHSLVAMLEAVKNGRLTIGKLVEKMCHAPAICFQVKDRGFIREGYLADLVLIDDEAPWTVNRENLHYKCGWSPFDGVQFNSKITHTFVNGNLVYENGKFYEHVKGKRLIFNR
mgnify:CR=1 FL=1